jgi:MFS family permease
MPSLETPLVRMATSGRERLVLPVVLAGMFTAVLDAIVNVTIPSIRRDPRVGFAAVELVISGYALTYACLAVTGGRLGDTLGRRPRSLARPDWSQWGRRFP